MKVTVLGCGPSSGVPMVGNDWGACDPTNPRNRRRRVSILLAKGATRVLVDTSADLREQCLDAAIDSIDAVVYTHGHADHTHGIDDLRGFNHIRSGPLDVYGEPETLATIRARFGYAFERLQYRGPWYRPSLVAKTINGAFRIGEIEIVPFAQGHGRVDTLGLRIGRFAYSTDVNQLTEAAFAALADLDVWIVDCARYQPNPGHAHLPLTLNWIERLAPRRAILTHMSSEFDYQTLANALPAGVEPAYDGMVIEVAD